MHPQGRIGIGFQGLANHFRSQIGAADSDIDHVANALAGVATPFAAPNLVSELARVLQNLADFRHHILSLDVDRPVASIAQGNVQHGPLFGMVDDLAVKHPLGPGRYLRLAGQLDQ